MNQPTCGDCRFYFLPKPDEPGEGLCRRYPPTVYVTRREEILMMLPPTRAQGWCGEHAPKNDTPAANQ